MSSGKVFAYIYAFFVLWGMVLIGAYAACKAGDDNACKMVGALGTPAAIRKGEA